MVKLRDRKVKVDKSLDPDRAWKMLGETPVEHWERLEREEIRSIDADKYRLSHL